LLTAMLLGGCALFNNAPLASFTSTPITGTAPLAVQFASTSVDPDGDALTFQWSFGDGGSAVTPTVSHTYTTAGQFTVTLQVTDRWGAQGSASQTIVVTADGGDVNADFTASTTSGTAPLTVTFNATTSTCAGAGIVAYQWSFGDGASATGATTSHTYSTAGTYIVTLTVVDDLGRSDTETVVITVSENGGGGSC
jgi:chitinase